MLTPISAVRPIPANPNLEFDRKRAKSLLDAAKRGDAGAIGRVKAHHPRFTKAKDLSNLALHDAQLVVAREYGFASWPRWKDFVETRRLDRASRAAELIKAACSNDVRKARVMLEAEPGLASFDFYSACACGQSDTVERVLSQDPSLANRAGGPLGHEPILYACFSRFLRADPIRRRGILRSVRSLLDHGANPYAFYWHQSEDENWLQSTLYAAGGIVNDLELLTILLDAGARLDERDKETLYHTIEFPDPACLRLLLERGNVSIEQCSSYMARATDYEYPAHVRLLLAAGADPNHRCKWDGQRTQLHKAVYLARSTGIIEMMVDAGGDVNAIDEYGISILRTAVRSGNLETVALLKSRGAHDVGITESDLRQGDPITLCIAASRNDIATIDRLLDGGADINAPAAPDRTPPLHWAAWRGRFNAVRRLVERGADIHFVNGYGGAAINMAIHGSANCFDPDGGPGMRLHEEAYPGDYPQIIEYLIANSAKLPDRINGGSDVVQELLRRHGVPDTL